MGLTPQEFAAAADALRGQLGIEVPSGTEAPVVTPEPTPAVAPTAAPAPSAPAVSVDTVSRDEFVRLMGIKDRAIDDVKAANTALLGRLEALEARPASQPASAPTAPPASAFEAMQRDLAHLKESDRRTQLEATYSVSRGYKPGIVDKHWEAVTQKMELVPGLTPVEAMQLVATGEDLSAAPASASAAPTPRVEGGPSGTGGVESGSARQTQDDGVPLSVKLNAEATELFNSGRVHEGKQMMEEVMRARAMELLEP